MLWVLVYFFGTLAFVLVGIFHRLYRLQARMDQATARRKAALEELAVLQKAGDSAAVAALQEKMQAADRYFNEVVILYNSTIEAFPSSWAAACLGLRPATPLPIEL